MAYLRFPEGVHEGNFSQHADCARYRLEVNGNLASDWMSWVEMRQCVARRFPPSRIRTKLHYGPWHSSCCHQADEFYRAVLDGFEQVACICAQPLPPAPLPSDAALLLVA
jgi:hypothetical protein